MKLILHIGTEKTGTTSIQQFLNHFRPELAEKNIHFIRSVGPVNNRALPSMFMERGRLDDYYFNLNIRSEESRMIHDERMRFEFEKELSNIRSNVDFVVISSEHFHSRLREPNELKNLKDYLSRFFSKIHIICYLREQTSLCSSLYSTALKSGNVIDSSVFKKQCNVNNPYYNFDKFLSLWQSVFYDSTITAHPFARSELYKEDIISDFLNKIGINIDEFDTTDLKLPSNKGLSESGLKICYAINKTFERYNTDGTINHDRVKLISLVESSFAGSFNLFNKEEQGKIKHEFTESNDRVSSKFKVNLSSFNS